MVVFQPHHEPAQGREMSLSSKKIPAFLGIYSDSRPPGIGSFYGGGGALQKYSQSQMRYGGPNEPEMHSDGCLGNDFGTFRYS